LRPGKPLVLLDYFNYLAARVYPICESSRALFEAYQASAIANGGNYDIGDKLPAILKEEGFKLAQMKPICRIGRPVSPIWHWIEKFNQNYIPKLVKQGLMSPQTRRKIEADWEQPRSDVLLLHASDVGHSRL
jgi:hypothetical protein